MIQHSFIVTCLTLWDLLSAAFSIAAGFRLSFSFVRPIPAYYLTHQLELIVINGFLAIGFTMLFGGYQKNIRRTALWMPLRQCVVALACGGVILWIDRIKGLGVPWEVIAITCFSLFAAQCLGRVILGLLLSFLRTKGIFSPNNSKVFIYGAGELGQLLAERLTENAKEGLTPVGYLDDFVGPGTRAGGLKVLGTLAQAGPLISDYQVKGIVLAIDKISPDRLEQLLALAVSSKIWIKRFGLSDQNAHTQPVLGEINPEELLHRQGIHLDMESVGQLLRDSVVLITGAAGSIGSEISRQTLTFGAKLVILVDFHENGLFALDQELSKQFDRQRYRLELGSIQDSSRLNQLFEKYHPQIVLHAAAHKHVPMMELCPLEAVKNNIFGTINVATTAIQYHSQRFILISTDKAVNPTNVMGATKRIAELMIQWLNEHTSTTKLCAVRFGNVLGSNGSVVPTFQKQIAHGGPVTVTHPDMTRYFMTIPEAVELVLEAAAMANGGEIFILDMGKPIKIYQLACDMIRLAGKKPGVDIPIVFTGIRPGEKLAEEICLAEERTSTTANSHILINQPVDLTVKEIEKNLGLLEEAIKNNDLSALLKTMTQLVPTFHPSGQPVCQMPKKSL